MSDTKDLSLLEIYKKSSSEIVFLLSKLYWHIYGIQFSFFLNKLILLNLEKLFFKNYDKIFCTFSILYSIL